MINKLIADITNRRWPSAKDLLVVCFGCCSLVIQHLPLSLITELLFDERLVDLGVPILRWKWLQINNCRLDTNSLFQFYCRRPFPHSTAIQCRPSLSKSLCIKMKEIWSGYLVRTNWRKMSIDAVHSVHQLTVPIRTETRSLITIHTMVVKLIPTHSPIHIHTHRQTTPVKVHLNGKPALRSAAHGSQNVG